MKITCDAEGDAMYIELRDAEKHAGQTVEIGKWAMADLDEDGEIVGFEILFLRDHMTDDEIANISYEELVSEAKAALALPETKVRFR